LKLYTGSSLPRVYGVHAHRVRRVLRVLMFLVDISLNWH
jgi:hypothetical protein